MLDAFAAGINANLSGYRTLLGVPEEYRRFKEHVWELNLAGQSISRILARVAGRDEEPAEVGSKKVQRSDGAARVDGQADETAGVGSVF